MADSLSVLANVSMEGITPTTTPTATMSDSNTVRIHIRIAFDRRSLEGLKTMLQSLLDPTGPDTEKTRESIAKLRSTIATQETMLRQETDTTFATEFPIRSARSLRLGG